MKNSFLILILLLVFQIGFGQNETTKTRKQLKAERKENRIIEIKNLLAKGDFKFYATNALPMGGGSISLSSYFDARICNDSIYSYLPFYGRAYHVDYGNQNSPLSFEQAIREYALTKDKKGYHIEFETKNKNDIINFNFQISEIGYASLIVTSTNRQSISFYGTIEKSEEKEESDF